MQSGVNVISKSPHGWPKIVNDSKPYNILFHHYSAFMLSAMTSQITGVSIVCSTVCSGAAQRKHQSSASLAREIHLWLVDSPQRANNSEKVSIWWRHQETWYLMPWAHKSYRKWSLITHYSSPIFSNLSLWRHHIWLVMWSRREQLGLYSLRICRLIIVGITITNHY